MSSLSPLRRATLAAGIILGILAMHGLTAAGSPGSPTGHMQPGILSVQDEHTSAAEGGNHPSGVAGHLGVVCSWVLVSGGTFLAACARTRRMYRTAAVPPTRTSTPGALPPAPTSRPPVRSTEQPVLVC